MKSRLAPLMLLIALLPGCSRKGEVMDGGVFTVRSACPLVGVPAATGDITMFNPPGNITSAAIDVTATITNVRGACQEGAGADVVSTVSFDVLGQRRVAGPARTVVLPFFSVIVQGGTEVVAKRVGAVALNFPEGSLRAQAASQATSRISRSVATLPENVRQTLTRRRKPGDADAAVDPLTDPTVRAAVARATFEQLVGFQLTDAQLRYNATR